MERGATAIRYAVALHHEGIARGRNRVVVFLYEEAVFPEIESVLFKPSVILAPKYFPTATTHSVVHLRHAGLNRNATVLKCCFLVHHIKTGVAILLHKRHTGASQSLLPTIGPARPSAGARTSLRQYCFLAQSDGAG